MATVFIFAIEKRYLFCVGQSCTLTQVCFARSASASLIILNAVDTAGGNYLIDSYVAPLACL